MGLISVIRSSHRTALAQMVLQNLLYPKARLIEGRGGTHTALAGALITLGKKADPDLFDDRYGQMPHKFALAAFCLATAIDGKATKNRNVMILCLGEILAEVEANGHRYPFTNFDLHILAVAGEVFLAACEEE